MQDGEGQTSPPDRASPGGKAKRRPQTQFGGRVLTETPGIFVPGDAGASPEVAVMMQSS